ncbi:threonine synthase [Pseudomarimonas salicorniae]|uniref:Threonine synthase n=1 Tax=Pseudomarimonas salicorniae TaxID=2933270 RepID=A0ABT0GKF5_9GAMM|nr:threonine synthase [Lysobacter sp. CAU 1642]MCK7595031.1 threonine synthase [Lysobacter sp. CAU 1642]
MSYLTCLRGLASGRAYPADQPMNLDPVDGRPVVMELDLERLALEQPDAGWYRPQRRDMWRFGALLALDAGNPAEARHIVPLGEGATPQLDYRDWPAARSAQLELWVKEEGRAHPGFGANPTQSFKDRGMAMVVAQARRLGLRRLAVPTQGNAGDSLVRYALAGGLDVVVAMPEDTPLPILGSVAAAAHRHPDRVQLHLVGPTIREAGAFLKERFVPEGWFSVATFQEPGWRIEGKKTLGLELAEPREGSDRWSLPDAVVYPTGGGTGVLGMWKAWDELERLGLIDGRRPRMLCVQSASTQPLVQAFEAGAEDTQAVAAGQTLATGLNVPGGVGHFRVLQIIRESGGAALAVSERDMAAALQQVWRARRDWISPEGAACLAALPQLLDRGLLRPRERVVVVNTGSLEKYLPQLRHLL